MLKSILDNYRTILALMVFMVIAGLLTYITIPKEADPDIDVPIFHVSIPYQGISPEDAERLLVKPMETHLRGLDGLKELTGLSYLGGASIIAEFQVTADHSQAAQDLREKLDQAKAELPQEADEPIFNEINMSLFPVISVILSGNVPERTLTQKAKQLRRELEAIPTVLNATLTGEREELLAVEIDPEKLEAYNVSPGQLARVISRSNQQIPAGSLDQGTGRFNVKVPGVFKTAEDLINLPIKNKGDQLVTLGQIAKINPTFKTQTSFSRYRGKPALIINITKRKGANIIHNNEQVRAVAKAMTKSWPQSINVNFAIDRSDFITEVQGSLESAILTAIFLVVLVILATLGPRSALLVGFSIPASFLIGFLLIGLSGMTVNMMLMFGLVLTVGLLVDSAIILTEYADRKLAEGLSRAESYKLAASRMFWPIVSSTATTLAAFMPLLLWPGVPGKFMSYLPITVIYVLASSLITALIFLPVLGRFIGKTDHTKSDQERAKSLSSDATLDIDQFPGFTGRYIRFVNFFIDRPFKLIGITAACLAMIFLSFQNFSKGVEFFVETEPEQVIIFVKARGNQSATQQRALVGQAEKIILANKYVSTLLTSTGAGGTGPEFGTGVTDAPPDQIGQIIIEFTPYGSRPPGKDIMADLREKLKTIPGVMTEVRQRESGPPVGKAIRLEFYSTNLKTAQDAARKTRSHLQNKMAGIRDIEDSLPLPGLEWQITVNRAEAGRFDTDIASVGGMIQLVTDGILIGTYRPDNSEDEVDIRALYPKEKRNITNLDKMQIYTSKGLVPISNFAKRTPVPPVNTITKKNGRFTVTLKADVKDGVNGNEKVGTLKQWLDGHTWPENLSYKFRGADEEQKESGEFLGKAMFGALFIMFLILLTQYNSFYQTALTLMTVILSCFGVLLGMLLTGQSFSIIMTGTGIVALAGIVVNNAIVLIDTFNRFIKDGAKVRTAALKAATQRLRPVLLTTITTICGLLPMALEINLDFFNRIIHFGSMTSTWWVQMATAIIFGLSFATLLTLVLIPVLLAQSDRLFSPFKRTKQKNR